VSGAPFRENVRCVRARIMGMSTSNPLAVSHRLPAFMEALPAYLESPAGKKEETSRAVTMLMQMCEFEEFKEMMMYVKKQRDDEAANVTDLLGDAKVSDGAVLSVDGLMDMCSALAASGATDEGWVCPHMSHAMQPASPTCTLRSAAARASRCRANSRDRPHECARTRMSRHVADGPPQAGADV
jgi:hypothetical protein